MKPLRIAVAGLVHDHAWQMLPQFARLPGVKLVAAADPNRPLREKIRKEFGVTALFGDAEEMFDGADVDAVMVCTSNAGGVPVVEAAAKRGIHAMVEKPMAHTAAGAKRMYDAAKRGRIRLMINWPIAWWPSFAGVLDRVAAGEIGHVFHARIHMAHQGPKEAGCTPYFYGWLYDAKQNGAGALVDYCCYGANVMATLWGRPKRVVGHAGTLAKKNFPVDDNALVVALWPNRTVLSQASWTQNPDYHEMTFLGTDGTLETARGRIVKTRTRPEDFSHWGAERMNAKSLPLPKFPPGRRNGPDHFVHCLRTGTPFLRLCSAESGLLAQEILSAGLKSDRSGKRERV